MIILLPGTTGIDAQNTVSDFTRPDKTWTEGYNWISFEGESFTWSYRYKFDSLPVNIGAQTYYRLLKANTEFSEDWADTGDLIRDSGGRIYWYFSNGEQLMYDFNLVQGDTFHLYTTPSYYSFVVMTVDTISLLNGDLRKHWELRPITGDDPAPAYLWIDWIEGIGNINGLFSNELPWIADAAWSTVLCVYAGDTMLYKNTDYETCWLMATATNETLQYEISFVPNPATDHITIVNPEAEIQAVHIFDACGKLMYKGNNQVVLLSDFPSGYYYTIVQLKNNTFGKFGFVKI